MNLPVPLSQGDLVLVLREMADRIEVGDSFEGSIEYSMPIDEQDIPEDTYAMVRAAFRVGNRQGQGGMKVIGREGRPPFEDAVLVEE